MDGGLTYDAANVIEDMGKYGDVRRRYIVIDGVHNQK